MSESALTYVVCPDCHKTNRLPTARLADQPRCGACGQPVFPGRPIELSAASFETHLTRSDLPLVVDFWAPWCGPCKMMAPAFAEAARKIEPKARLAKVNTEDEQALARRFDIRSIPTLVVFKQGREVTRQSGAIDARRLEAWLAPYL